MYCLQVSLKMKAAPSSKTMDFYRLWDYNPEDSILHIHCCENLKSNMSKSVYTYWLSCSNMVEAFITSFFTTGPIRIFEY
jgi:hypothetical protein